MVLIANCALLRIPIDTGRLFDGDDDYEIAISSACERVSDYNRREAERAQRRMNRG